MLFNDLFESDREPYSKAIDKLEVAHINALNAKMDEIISRVNREKLTPEHKQALKQEYIKLKAERDSIYGIKDGTPEFTVECDEEGNASVIDRIGQAIKQFTAKKFGSTAFDAATAYAGSTFKSADINDVAGWENAAARKTGPVRLRPVVKQKPQNLEVVVSEWRNTAPGADEEQKKLKKVGIVRRKAEADKPEAKEELDEGWQDFNKVEPYEVCLAGKPVKTFDYYEEARRFHDNWKQKLYREGNKEKADRITLNPIMKEGIWGDIKVNNAIRRHERKQDAAMAAGDYDTAKKEIRRAAKIDNKFIPDKEVEEGLGSALTRAGKYVTGSGRVDRAIKNHEAWMHLAQQRGDHDDFSRENEKASRLANRFYNDDEVEEGISAPTFKVGDAMWTRDQDGKPVSGEVVELRPGTVVFKTEDGRKFRAPEGRVMKRVHEEKQKGVDGKACWDGYKRMGTKQKGGKTVDNCVKMEEDWQKANKKDKTDGMSDKAVKAYRRENPGSKLKTAVTTKPSKLKPGSKDAKRRKSFCARMSGNKGPMKDEKGRPTPKAKALSRWNCEEGTMADASHHASGAKFGGYYKGTQVGAPRPGQSFGAESVEHENPMNDKELAYLIAKAKGMKTQPDPALHKGDDHEIHSDKDFVGESMNFMEWAVSQGSRFNNFATNPEVYAKAKQAFFEDIYGGIPKIAKVPTGAMVSNAKLPTLKTNLRKAKEQKVRTAKALNRNLDEASEAEAELQPGQYYVWTVHFDDGTQSKCKVTSDQFDPKAYYAKKNKVVIKTDYDWTIHG